MDEYEALEVIGRGSYGTVRKVRRRADGAVLVRKEIEYHSMNTLERNQLVAELRILRELHHPNIVRYLAHEHLPERRAIHIYMEYCDGGDLALVVATFKRDGAQVPEEFVWQVLVQTLLALHRCHYGVDAKPASLFGAAGADSPRINRDTVIIHRDIKPDNIFLHAAQVKVGDFGLAKMLTSQSDFAKTYVGTPYYMSPEVLRDEPYLPVCDVWLLGCVLYELCALAPPFDAKLHVQLQAKIKMGAYAAVSDNYSQHLRAIIDDCITVDPRERPTVFELLERLPVKFLRKEMELGQREAEAEAAEARAARAAQRAAEREAEAVAAETRAARAAQRAAEREAAAREREAAAREREAARDAEWAARDAEWATVAAQHRHLEAELRREFDAKRHAMDLEAREVRLGYQREFRLVVEQEVQARVRQIVARQGLAPRAAASVADAAADAWDADASPASPRAPLRARNFNEPYKAPRARARITDELERAGLDKRHTPEFEEMYYRR